MYFKLNVQIIIKLNVNNVHIVQYRVVYIFTYMYVLICINVIVYFRIVSMDSI